MRLDRFRAGGVHGYLDFDVRFRKDLTFLTGINGSGKTTAINALIALITPDLSTLSNLSYSFLSVDLVHAGQKLSISASGDDETFSLSVTGTPEPLTFARYIYDPDAPPIRQADHETEYFRELALSHATHPVMRQLASLPTPMFLGLDRRARFEADDRRRVYARAGRLGRNVFSISLARSLQDAAELAATANRDAIISSARIGDELRRDLLLSLLTVAPEEYGHLVLPTETEVAELAQIRRDLDTFPQIFSLPREDVRKRILPFLDELQRSVDTIPAGTKISEILKGEGRNQKILQSMLRWGANRSQLKRIRVISETVKYFNELRSERQKPIQKYAKLVDQFLEDSGKSIAFDQDGYPYVAISGIEDRKPISSLSSGEAQIFVILTHLSFNQNAQSANVFIVDEPELSLHVLWQELFVESVQSANPNIQYIMATHSPSIILDKDKYCVDLSKSRRGAGRAKVLSKGR